MTILRKILEDIHFAVLIFISFQKYHFVTWPIDFAPVNLSGKFGVFFNMFQNKAFGVILHLIQSSIKIAVQFNADGFFIAVKNIYLINFSIAVFIVFHFQQTVIL